MTGLIASAIDREGVESADHERAQRLRCIAARLPSLRQPSRSARQLSTSTSFLGSWMCLKMLMNTLMIDRSAENMSMDAWRRHGGAKVE